ncbi:MAG: hypothetical protein ACOCZ8_00225 [Bacteroidota bacterium]
MQVKNKRTNLNQTPLGTDNQLLSVRYVSQGDFWEANWQGELSVEQVKFGLETVLRIFRTQPTRRMLFIQRDMISGSLDLQSWMYEHLVPPMYALGLRRVGLVHSRDFDTRAATTLIMDSVPPDFSLDARFFLQYDEAVEWLLSR